MWPDGFGETTFFPFFANLPPKSSKLSRTLVRARRRASFRISKKTGIPFANFSPNFRRPFRNSCRKERCPVNRFASREVSKDRPVMKSMRSSSRTEAKFVRRFRRNSIFSSSAKMPVPSSKKPDRSESGPSGLKNCVPSRAFKSESCRRVRNPPKDF